MNTALVQVLRRMRRGSLRKQVRAHLPVLPVLRRQLQQTSAEMEQSVVAITRNFSGMAGQVRDIVARASHLLGSADAAEAGAGTVEALVDSSRATMQRLIDRMERSSAVSLQAVKRMEEVESGMRRIEKAIAEVDRISFSNKLLALNARIEAAHVGEAGSGFGIVADEISNQAYRSTEITEEIDKTISSLSAAVQAAAGELRTMASEDRELLGESRREVTEALDALGRTHDEMTAALQEASARNERIADEIGRAVTGLQFQDRLSQRISHVVESLAAMEESLSGHASAAGHESAVLQDLQRSYTMHAERAVHGNAAESPEAVAVAAPGGEGDVELF
ncbi:MAG TPA: methyl-accepting chemotaxis protein [Bryobacteraceae bacterium]|nr:methyl-accepting chemotaxis protein [Bryobacteraceae bacterium]